MHIKANKIIGKIKINADKVFMNIKIKLYNFVYYK